MSRINRAAVIGAGTMGAAIAAHLANSGRPVLLLDTVPTELTAAEAARGLTLSRPAVRNRLALAGLERVKNAHPPALFTPETARLITVGNVEDGLGQLSEVDWIVEAVTERLDVKRALFERIEAVRSPETTVSSNTSGLPIGQIAAGRSADFRAHFLGTHFFNPPRQMKLLEVTPTPDTLPEVTAAIRDLGERELGKGVVLCKDTPNFIGNRLFTFDLVFALVYAIEHGYTVEEVDLLTGPLIGRPRTGTFRLLDLVGLDVMAMVGDNLYPNIPDDESRELLRSPRLSGLTGPMIERGWLGNKSHLGFYKEVRDGGGRAFWALDLETLEHRPPRTPALESLAAIQKERDLAVRLRLLAGLDDRAGQLVRAVLANFLGYASRRLPEVADDVQSVDRAMRWGFNHQLGPFEIWDAFGLTAGQRLVDQHDPRGVAPWVDQLIASGRSAFYQDATYWSVARAAPEERVESPDALSLSGRKARSGVVVENAGASLVDLGDGIAALELHTKLNTLDERVVELIQRALEKTRTDFRGLVLT
ncbi:MAG: 3-hydroxyacyl-CoA dehydrogenase NAD-binding domain-containing protein, partial [Chloroflexota bacterium]